MNDRFFIPYIYIFICFSSSVVYAGPETEQLVFPREFPEYNPLEISLGDGDRSLSVLSDEYKPAGIRTGDFMFFPDIKLTGSYADNVFFSNTDKKSDFISVISPIFQMRSDWSNHQLNLYSMMDHGLYARNETEDFTDFTFGADARIDIQRDFYIKSDVFFSKNHQIRANPDSNVDSSTPTIFYHLSPSFTIYKQFNHMFIMINGLISKYDFDNDRAKSGIVINNDTQERTVYQSSFKLGYQFNPHYSISVLGLYNNRDYKALPVTFTNRDSKENMVAIGTTFDLKKLSLSGVAQVGVVSRNFYSPVLNDTRDIAFKIELTWNGLRRLQLKTKFAQEIQETSQSDVSNILSTIFEYQFDYEIYHNLNMSYNLASIRNKYRMTSRVDNIFLHELNLKYQFDKSLYFSMDYNYVESDSPSLQFKVNMFSVRVGVSY